MALFMNAPDKVVADAFSDNTLRNNANGGAYSSFTNQLNTPVLGLKGVQLLRMNFVNSALQLNDNTQLMFFYYRGTTAATTVSTNASNLYCVRLVPSNFVPLTTGFTAYTRNQYFNSVSELVTALNAAASTGGDSITYNPKWSVGDITFSYSTSSRRISFTGNTASRYYAPAAADDPVVIAYMKTNAITLNNYTGTTPPQPYALNQSMNARLGFAQSYYNRGTQVPAVFYIGAASSTQNPQPTAYAIEADAFPILLGVQSINVYMNIAPNSGYDSKTAKNLIASIPVESASQYVGSYTLTSVEQPASSVQSEVYTITFSFTDEYGNPYFFNANNNVTVEFNCFYDKNKMTY
jgi:hypothetical protein